MNQLHLTYCNNSSMIFEIINAIGSLATFGGFLYLFFQNKDNQAQIDKLSTIATNLEAQNEIMKEQNNLISQQVDIFRNTSILKEQNKGALGELISIEQKKLKLSARPFLWLNGASARGYDGELSIDLNNKGEDAELLQINLKSQDIVLQPTKLPFTLEKGQRLNIFGRKIGGKPIHNSDYEIDVVYQDKLENKYLIRIQGTGARVQIVETKELPEGMAI